MQSWALSFRRQALGLHTTQGGLRETRPSFGFMGFDFRVQGILITAPAPSTLNPKP